MALTRFFCFLLLTLILAAEGRAQMLDDIAQARPETSAKAVETVGKRAVHGLISTAVAVPFTGIAVQIVSDDPGVQAEVRIQRAGVWGEWSSMRLVRSAVGDGMVAGYRGPREPAGTRFEIRVSADEAASLRLTDSGTFDNTLDEDARPLPAPQGLAPIPGKVSGTIIPPPLITRAEWGARPFAGGSPSPLGNPGFDYMTFHHAAGYSATTREEGLAQLRAIQDLHQDVRGWSDIGYQFVIDRGGRLYQGRPFLNNATSLNDLPILALGAHVGGANTGNIGVSLLGCYHPPEGGHCQQEITPEALDTYITLFAFLSERYGVSPARIRGHRDFSLTACPGDNNYALLPGIMGSVTELLETGNAPIAQASLLATADAGGVVKISWEFTADFGVVSYRVERWVDEQRSAVLAQGVGAVPSSVADDGVVSGDRVSYRLYVTGTDGREQRVASADVILDLPSRHAIADVFPNPTSGGVRFRYYLPSRGRVALQVYDGMGRRVATLVDAVQEGESWYAIPFDTTTLTPGVYYYRLQVEGFSGVAFDRARPLVVV